MCLRPACWSVLAGHFFNRGWRSGDHHICFAVSSGPYQASTKLQASFRISYFVTITDALLASMNQRFDGILQRVLISKAPRLPDSRGLTFTSSQHSSTPNSVCNGMKSQRAGVHYKHYVVHFHPSERSSSPTTPADRRLQVPAAVCSRFRSTSTCKISRRTPCSSGTAVRLPSISCICQP